MPTRKAKSPFFAKRLSSAAAASFSSFSAAGRTKKRNRSPDSVITITEDAQAPPSSFEQAQKRAKHRSTILQIECPDPTKCIDLGTFKSAINLHFDHFRGFQYVNTARIRKIGSDSVNGFVLQLPFEREGYVANTILKSANAKSADNLMYEYKVGVDFINLYTRRFPCFVETYLLGKYKNKKMRDLIKQRFVTHAHIKPRTRMPPLSDIIQPIPANWAEGCANSENICVLIQYFDRVISLNDFADRYAPELYQNYSTYMYQIYFALGRMTSVYTHYDLHGENVLLYKPFEGKKYVQMHYHITTNNVASVISFATERIAKIIDYGRNYFGISEEVNSTRLIQEVCAEPNCDPDCGKEVGFSAIHGSEGQSNRHVLAKNYADPTRPNKSHDLGLILDFSDFQQEQQITLPLPDHLFRGSPPELYSFPEYKSSRGIKRKNGKTVIHTVSDLCFHLETHREWTTNTIFDDTWECMGDIHVFSDGRPYRFIYRKEPSMKPVTAKKSK